MIELDTGYRYNFVVAMVSVLSIVTLADSSALRSKGSETRCDAERNFSSGSIYARSRRVLATSSCIILFPSPEEGWDVLTTVRQCARARQTCS
jgi:hypothetical protein